MTTVEVSITQGQFLLSKGPSPRMVVVKIAFQHDRF